MIAAPKILILEHEPQFGAWLRHHLEILYAEAPPLTLDPATLDADQKWLATHEFDLILYGAHVPEGAPVHRLDAAFAPLPALCALPGAPVVVVFAEGGDETAAVRALRLGAWDYLPRRALDATVLAAALTAALEERGHRLVAAAEATRAAGLEAAREAEPPAAAGGTGTNGEGAVADGGIAEAAPAEAAAAEGAEPDAVPELPHYRLLQCVGQSGRASVFLAWSEALDAEVALKISRPGAYGDDGREMFAREYAAIAALDHPGIVRIHDYGLFEGREYIAMEYFPCGDLKRRLLHPMSTAEALAYAQRICRALDAVHAAGMLHRDLKPPNIMLREDGATVLIDFGLAKRVNATTQLTAVGVLRGSPYYMSPEQALGMSLDTRSDLYSLGVILFEMLSGRKPFHGSSAIEVMQQHVDAPRPALPSHLRQFEPLVHRLMARDRDERFVSAAAVATELTQLSSQTLQTQLNPVLAHAG
jgi:DNA-binding NarL/FixJ family response regulator